MYHCGIQLDSKGYGHAEQTMLKHTETLKMRDIDKVTYLRMEATSSEPIGTEGCVMLGFRCPSRCNLSDNTANFPSNRLFNRLSSGPVKFEESISL